MLRSKRAHCEVAAIATQAAAVSQWDAEAGAAYTALSALALRMAKTAREAKATAATTRVVMMAEQLAKLGYTDAGMKAPKGIKAAAGRTATLVIGPPAAGKSTVANELARKGKAAIVDPDGPEGAPMVIDETAKAACVAQLLALAQQRKDFGDLA